MVYGFNSFVCPSVSRILALIDQKWLTQLAGVVRASEGTKLKTQEKCTDDGGDGDIQRISQ
jgi:hypothetical protein